MRHTTPSSQSVIIIEDNVAANRLIAEWLKISFTVRSFLDGASAMAELTPSDEVAVFLIDYNMPGDNGIELRKKLKPIYPNGKFILMSGLFDENLMSEAKFVGFDELLPKPFPLHSVTQKINSLLAISTKVNLVELVRKSGPIPTPVTGAVVEKDQA